MTDQPLPHWDLTNVYPGLNSPELASDFEHLVTELGLLEDQTAELIGLDGVDNAATTLSAALSKVITKINEILVLASTIQAYIYSFTSTDTFNQDAKRLMSQFEQAFVRFPKQINRLQLWAGRVQARLPEILEPAGAAHEHTFMLLEAARLSQFLMSEAEENLASDLNLSGANAWSKLHRTVTSQLSVPVEIKGETKTMPITAVINLRSDADEGVRRAGYEAENKAWEQVQEPLAAAINGIKGSGIVLNRHRGRKDALEVALDDARMDRETLDAMLGAMKASLPQFVRYFQAKAHRLGKQKLAWWDLFAPSGRLETQFTYAAARDFILTHFNAFSPDLSAFARRAFDQNWIDAEPRKGKVAGAFCMGVPAQKESRVLANFDGSLDQVFTLAHELGHGFHNHCQFSAGKTELQRSNPRTLAETASIMCETIVLNAALIQAANPQEELAILETSLVGDSQVIVDIYSRFLFESEVFSRREKSELSASELCEIMVWAQAEAYGEGLDENFRQSYMWTWKPHYYMPSAPFYNFPYAFGLLFGTGLYAIYLKRGFEFVEDYKKLLSNTGEVAPAELAQRFGIDIRQSQFWEDSLSVIGKRIDRYLEI